MSNPDYFNVCPKTIYNYVAMGILDTRNIDLHRKVTLAPRKTKKNQHKIDKKCRHGKNYDDYLKFMKKNPTIDVVEGDTVEGKKGEAVLLTLMFTSCSVQLSFYREHNDARSVINIINGLYDTLGHEEFCRLFPVLLLDNGTEFSDPEAIEYHYVYDEDNNIIDRIRRTYVFYCDPSAPYQKPLCERNHEFIRYFVPKGVSFNKYDQNDITTMMNHINNYVRTEKNLKSPYLRFIFLYGEATAQKLCLTYI